MRFAVVTVAVVAVVVVALSRVYLRAHYLTDVLGGVALGRRDLGARGHRRAVRRGRSSQWGATVSNDDQITYAVAGVAALISAGRVGAADRSIPAWSSYWRLRERMLAVVMSVYILAAFVGMGACVGGVVPLLLRPALRLRCR